MGQYKFLHIFALISVFTVVVVQATAGKLVDFFGTPMSVTVYFFPVIYVIADILTEVYGYAAARRVLWYTLAARALSALIFYLVLLAPPAASFTANEAYAKVLSSAPQIAFGGVLAVFAGDITNNYVLAKMKIWTKGEFQSARLVVSTIAGEFMNSLCFYGIGLYGIIPPDKLVNAVIMATLAKTIVEIVMLPITRPVIAWVKRAEHEDYYDVGTDFNPFKL